MRCDFCGHEFTEEEANTGCRGCPFGGNCHMLKCPRCNYEVPKEPALIRKLKKIFSK